MCKTAGLIGGTWEVLDDGGKFSDHCIVVTRIVAGDAEDLNTR